MFIFLHTFFYDYYDLRRFRNRVILSNLLKLIFEYNIQSMINGITFIL